MNKSLVGDHMYDYNMSREHKNTLKSRKLIGSYFGKQIIIYAPLLKWYLVHGLVITKTYSLIKAASSRPFKTFMERVSDARRTGDVSIESVCELIIEELSFKSLDEGFSELKTLVEKIKIKADEENINKALLLINKLTGSKIYSLTSDLLKVYITGSDQSMIAEMMKLIGNSAFGRSGMDKSKHKETKYKSCENSISSIVEQNRFYDVEELGEAYEITLKKRCMKLNNPIHLSIAIYQLAKLRMLEFYYDCVDFYFDRSDFQYQEMDTDSASISFSAENPFEELIKPELFEHYKAHKYDWFPRDYNKTVAAFDRRTPGLFKEEWRGNTMMSLSSKNYICYMGDENHKQKVSAKRAQQDGNRNGSILSPDGFENVVRNRITLNATNKGFRVDKLSKSTITYEQTKSGLNYYYNKRKVLLDGISTSPLDL